MIKIVLAGLSIVFAQSEVQAANTTTSVTSTSTEELKTSPKTNSPQSCIVDKDCDKQPFFICSENNICLHKDVFPIHWIEFIGTVVLPVLLGMANVGGIGGGGLIIPFLMTFWGFTTKESIAISNMTIAVGAIIRFFMSLKQEHPNKPATNIDYGIVIVMMPLVLLGTILGVLVNLVVSSLTLAIILTALLLFLTS